MGAVQQNVDAPVTLRTAFKRFGMEDTFHVLAVGAFTPENLNPPLSAQYAFSKTSQLDHIRMPIYTRCLTSALVFVPDKTKIFPVPVLQTPVALPSKLVADLINYGARSGEVEVAR
ncbi:hypothetical protein EIP91_005640 [Steccherinum ochraceum]|uniref:Uncharacterized protein n=1 Tax=Steccherinum ochraceum TaxID=92696 RepID=A0A4R0R798_9APHY|nr:hypothetical protein EIP91_005640 [Steccherinum ochraceum]